MGRRLGLSSAGGAGRTRLTWPATPQSGDFMRRKRRRATSNDKPSTPEQERRRGKSTAGQASNRDGHGTKKLPLPQLRLRIKSRTRRDASHRAAGRASHPSLSPPSMIPSGRPKGSISVRRAGSRFLLVPSCKQSPYRFNLTRIAAGSCWADQLGHAGPAARILARAGPFLHWPARSLA